MDDTTRRFSGRQRAALYLLSGGRCAMCDSPLRAGYHADHIIAHARGGPTDLTNGQALCASCNLHKGVRPIR